MTLECLPMECQKKQGRRSFIDAMASATLNGTSLRCGEAEPDRVTVYPAAGKITFKGQPTPGAVVTLHPKDAASEGVPSPRASVDKDGTFKLSTFNGGD